MADVCDGRLFRLHQPLERRDPDFVISISGPDVRFGRPGAGSGAPRGRACLDSGVFHPDIVGMALAERVATDDSTAVGRERRHLPFGAPHVFVMVIIDGGNPSSVHRITQTESIIGRGEEAQFIIDDEQVSKAHCKVRVEGSVCKITDLGSRNGTSVNGRRLNKDVAHRVRHLDEIEIGKRRMLLLAGRFRDSPKNSAV